MQVALKIAIQSLKNNKTRTILTILGIVIGIAAVIIVMSAGEGLKGQILGQLDSFGSDIIQIETKVPSTGRNSVDSAMTQASGVQITSLKIDDAEAIKKIGNISNYYGAIFDQEIVSYLNQQKSVNIIGATPSFIDMDQSEIGTGRYYSEDENNSQAKVVVLGYKVAEKLFGNQDPVGSDVKIGKAKFRVIGVLAERGGGFGLDFDDIIYMPLLTLQKQVMGIDYLQWITVKLFDTSIEDETAEEIIALLRERHDIEGNNTDKDDFSVTTMTEAKEMIGTIFNGITLLLIAIAGISLLVGGVGIMNIMYVSVSERTFEIGLRKAVGAGRLEILLQFLLEAVILTVLGGIVGIALGIGIAYLISFVAGLLGFDWEFILPPSSIFIAFGFSSAVGLIFGYYPAQKASKMNPINALRHE